MLPSLAPDFRPTRATSPPTALQPPRSDPVLQSSAPATIHATATGVASGIFDGSVAPLRRRVCWTSSGDYSSTSPSGVVIHGSGCATCLRGQRCSFRVSVRAPARWAHVLEADKESWWKRDLALTLRGIALAHGDIRCLDPPHCTEFRVSYRVWDLGNYWATLHVLCANLNFSASFTHHFNRTYQDSNLPCFPHSPSLPPTPQGNAARGDWPDTPCNGTSVPGRWVVKADGSLRWAFYRCAAPEIPPSEWIGALHERGIREISIVGDSHQRFLAAHLHFLLTAQADKDVKRWQDNLVFDARDSSNRTLRINFYWIDGIYKNGEFGCTHRGVTTNRSEEFPEISTTADVTLFEGGYWAASFCRQPLKALRVHLEEFARLQVLPRDSEEEGEGMERAGDESNGATESKGAADIEEADEIAAAGGADGGAGAGDGVSGGGKSYSEKRPPPPSPRAAAEAPSSELAALPVGAATVLDTWQVDAPRYADTAEPHDHHYSVVKPTKEGAVVVGEVGEAQVRAFIHYLLRVI
ncbi:unnamed protein product [Closterium sp. Naga37s-1]|nr:unnamed protein product [Closterium sp. Naga37s-1]